MTPHDAPPPAIDRRSLLRQGGLGLGAIALGSLMNDGSTASASSQSEDSGRDQGVLGRPHFAPRATNVIQLFMAGGPSHMDLFDDKPVLRARHGQEMPASVLGQQRVTLMTRNQGHFQAASTPYRFARHGQAGFPMSELWQHLPSVADDLCFIRSMHTEPINHDPAVRFMQAGRDGPGLPCMGSWMSYGLGSENRDLPAFIVMISGPLDQPVPARYYHSGFLPSRHQGVNLQSTGDPVQYLSNPPGVSAETRRDIVAGVRELNELRRQQVRDPEIDARIRAFELAFRMQTSAPEMLDISQETEETLDLYGDDVNQPGTFARNCLLARRLSERGVRFVQLFHRGWDQHANVINDVRRQALATDQACAGLIKDLKRRGMLDHTLVIWGGEFGRTAFGQGDLARYFGRDHHPRCFTYWLAGGGVKPGCQIGATDDYAYNVAERPIHVNDLHATLLHCLGVDHERLTYRHGGRDFRLTDVAGVVINDILR